MDVSSYCVGNFGGRHGPKSIFEEDPELCRFHQSYQFEMKKPLLMQAYHEALSGVSVAKIGEQASNNVVLPPSTTTVAQQPSGNNSGNNSGTTPQGSLSPLPTSSAAATLQQ
jgi:hypothetical protein